MSSEDFSLNAAELSVMVRLAEGETVNTRVLHDRRLYAVGLVDLRPIPGYYGSEYQLMLTPLGEAWRFGYSQGFAVGRSLRRASACGRR